MLAVTREDTEDVDEFLAKMKRVLSMAVAVDEGSALTQRARDLAVRRTCPPRAVPVAGECTLSLSGCKTNSQRARFPTFTP